MVFVIKVLKVDMRCVILVKRLNTFIILVGIQTYEICNTSAEDYNICNDSERLMFVLVLMKD